MNNNYKSDSEAREWDEIIKNRVFYKEPADYALNCKEYKQKQHAIWNEIHMHAISYCGDLRSRNVLDFGCGIGNMSLFFAEGGANLWVLDVSAEMIKRVKARFHAAGIDSNKIQYINADIDDASFGREQFDIIFCGAVLHHIPDLESLFNKFGNLLKTTGKIIFYEPYGSVISEWVRKSFKYKGKGIHTDDEKAISDHELSIIRSYFSSITLKKYSIISAIARFWFVDSRLLFRFLMGFDRLLVKITKDLFVWYIIGCCEQHKYSELK
jgi:2-polyprenyl-3-methyl-5-hydroxy-6-metoxy-1,4-benzoquinol methylase